MAIESSEKEIRIGSAVHEEREQVLIVVPIHNEERNLREFVDRVWSATQFLNIGVTLLFVDDGSVDASLSEAVASLDRFPGSRVLELSRNFGKEAALLAGMDVAMTTDFKALILIDADLQHPPELIPEMVERWQEGNDVVIAARESRLGDSVTRRVLSKLFYRVLNRLADVKIVDGDGDFRLLGRNVVEALCSLREHDRFTKGLYSWVGFRQTRIYTKFDQRRDGDSRFSIAKLFALAGSGITSFSAKPLRISLYVGIAIGLLSFLLASWIAVRTLMFGKELPGYASIFCGVMFIGGIQLASIGLLGEYLGRTYIQSKERPPYIIRKTIVGKQQ